MKFQTYSSTPGLERYPPQERFAAWRDVHKHLMRNDPPYRKRFYSYLSSIIWLTCILIAAIFGIGFIDIDDVRLALEIFAPFCYIGLIVFLAFRQQHFMNQSIGNCLQSSHGA